MRVGLVEVYETQIRKSPAGRVEVLPGRKLDVFEVRDDSIDGLCEKAKARAESKFPGRLPSVSIGETNDSDHVKLYITVRPTAG